MITPSLNGVRFAERAIESVRAQAYPGVEHIVLDAGSSDGTLEVYARYPGLRLIVEPDDGPHDAMNKGLAQASGEIVGFLNTDDCYCDDVFFDVAKSFRDDPRLEALAGGFVVVAAGRDDDGAEIARYDRPEGDGFDVDVLTLGAPGFNARFFRRTLFERIGAFDNGFDISGDREFLIRAKLMGVRGGVLPRVVYRYYRHAGSRTLDADRRNRLAIAEEHLRLARRYARCAASPEMRRALECLWAFESAKLLMADLGSARFGRALRRGADAIRMGPGLPLVLLAAIRVRRRVLEG